MFNTLRATWGYSAAIPLLSIIMGNVFHVPYWENLYAAALLWITTIVLLMLDDVIKDVPGDALPLYTEAELLEYDEAVDYRPPFITTPFTF